MRQIGRISDYVALAPQIGVEDVDGLANEFVDRNGDGVFHRFKQLPSLGVQEGDAEVGAGSGGHDANR